MRALRPIAIAITAGLLGCAGVKPPSDLVPGPHPYLATPSANRVRSGSPALGLATATPVETPTYEPVEVVPETNYVQHGGLPVGRRLRDIEGERRLYGAPVNDVSMLKATFNGISGIAPVDGLRDLRARTEVRADGTCSSPPKKSR